MKKILYLCFGCLILILIFIFLGFFTAKNSNIDVPRMATSIEYYDLNKAEIDRLSKLSQAGDYLAARRLADYFIHIKYDYPEAIKWLRIAYNDGDSSALYAIEQLSK
jgi:TPR repeat protein